MTGAGLLIVLLFAASLSGLWGLTLWRAAQNEAAARRSHPPLGPIVQVNGRDLHLRQEGQGPDIVLIHGASGNMRDFTFDLVARLAPHYRVTVMDRPGLGHSAPLARAGATIFEQADHLVAAMDRMGVSRPLVLGHSYGGAVALAWAARHPERAAGLVLLAAASNPWDGPLPTYYKVLSHPLGQRLAAPLLCAWAPQSRVDAAIAGVFAPQPVPLGYADHFGPALTLMRGALRENARQRAAILQEIDALIPHYAQLDLPVEILHGDRDTTVGLAIHSIPLSQQIAGARLTVMEGVGHAPHHADPAAVLAAIDRAARRAGLR